jgi:hypothetical protein
MKDQVSVRYVDAQAAVEIPGVGVVKRGQAITVSKSLAEELLARGGWEKDKGGKAAGGD